MAKEKLEIWITLRDRVTKGMQAVGKGFAALRGGVDRLKASVFNLRNAFIAVSTFFVGQKLISYADEQAKAVLGMEAALRSMGSYTPELSQKLQQIASDIQGVTNYGDEAILMGQKFLITYKDIGLDLMPRVSMAMADLAALMGGDMRQAANMLGKASMGMTGELRRVGITVDANVYKMEGFVGVLKAIENQSKGQALAMRAATGSMVAMSNSFLDVKEKAGDFLKVILEPGFAAVLNTFDKLNASIQKLKDEGNLDEWANEMSFAFANTFEKMTLGMLTVYEEIAPIMKNFKKLFTSMWDWFKSLPTGVQTFGLVGFMLLGIKGKATIIAVGVLYDKVKELDEALRDWGETAEQTEEKEIGGLKARLGYYLKLLEWQEKNEKATDDTIKKIQGLRLELSKLGVDVEGILPIDLLADVDDGLDKVAKARLALKNFFDEWREGIKKVAKPPEPKAPLLAKVKEPKAVPLDLATEVSKQLLSLEVLYQRGEEELIAYLERRKALVLLALGAEMGKIEEAAKAEGDVAKRLAIEDQLFIKRQEYALKEIELTKAIAQAHKDSFNRKVEVEGMFADLRLRSQESMDVIHAEELAEMDERQRLEFEAFQKLLDDKLAAELDYVDKSAALKDIQAEQQKEKDALMAKQDKEASITKLTNASDVVGGMGKIANDLYAMSGKNDKRLFRLAKAAAIAQAVINGALAVSKANDGTYIGYAKMAIAAAIAGVQVAKIRGTEMGGSFAEGGIIPGSSPHSKSDNIAINATAGEYMQPVSSVKYYGSKVMDGIKNLAFPKEMFSGFALPTLSPVGGRTRYAEGGAITALKKTAERAPKIEIVNVTNPDAIRGLAMDAVHENRDIVVNMVLQGLEDRNITLYKEF